MGGLEQFLERAMAAGADKEPHWEISLNDGTSERGRIVDVLADAIVVRQTAKRSSANMRHQAVEVFEDVVHALIPFTSIKLARVLARGHDEPSSDGEAARAGSAR